jgi:F-type H+-transporting ATPase subunit delta
VTSRAAASRYARALFDVIRAEGDVEAVQGELQQFADLITYHEALAHTLANPAIPASRKRGVAQALLDRAGAVAVPLRKLILLLADRDRLSLLPQIASAYRDRLLDHQKIVRGEVVTAVSVESGTLRALEREFGAVTGRRVMLESRIDPAIIGGAVTRLGSTVYDGSITTQLERMKRALAETDQ